MGKKKTNDDDEIIMFRATSKELAHIMHQPSLKCFGAIHWLHKTLSLPQRERVEIVTLLRNVTKP